MLTLTQLGFLAGPGPDLPPLDLTPPAVTVLVGPNGSGKSKALAEIDDWARGLERPRDVIREVEAAWPTYDQARALLAPYEMTTFPPGEGTPPQTGSFRVSPAQSQDGSYLDISESQLRHALDNGDAAFIVQRRQLLMSQFSLRLTGRERHMLVDEQVLGNLTRPRNHLSALFVDNARRSRVSDIVYQAFQLYFTLDPTKNVGRVRVNLNRIAPPDEISERGLTEQGVNYHAHGIPISSLSDGMQAFTGLVAGIFGLPHRLILVDEPEAFLPPPVARRLGSAIANVGTDRDATVVAATHSAGFVMGCIESGASTTIVRLTYDQATGSATARKLETSDLLPLMRDPLLRSANALDGLFHRAVVVTEADADRAFYDEINRRLVLAGRGIADSQFVNAQNWQTTARVIAPLRRLGVPAVAILDLDAIWNARSQWKPFYKAFGLRETDAEWIRLDAVRTSASLTEAERVAAKGGGVAAVPAANRAAVRQALKAFAEYGVFLCPLGELEAWLAPLNVRGPKKEWIVEMFKQLGSNPGSKSYRQPSNGDVWSFLDELAAWVDNPARRGMGL
jgi:predicted ABC-type transport system involved in lysophospholipase L1 biosynthesis ATPase subunit